MAYTLIGDSGTVVLDGDGIITSEGAAYSASVTSNPIEGGGNISDHAVLDPLKVDLSGIATSNAARATLEAMWRNRDLIAYRGIEAHDHLLITKLDIARSSDNRGGYSFKLSLVEVRIASAAFVPVTGPTMRQMDTDATPTKGAGKAAKPNTNKGLQTTTQGGYMTDHVSSFYASGGSGRAAPNPNYPGYTPT